MFLRNDLELSSSPYKNLKKNYGFLFTVSIFSSFLTNFLKKYWKIHGWFSMKFDLIMFYLVFYYEFKTSWTNISKTFDKITYLVWNSAVLKSRASSRSQPYLLLWIFGSPERWKYGHFTTPQNTTIII